MRKYPLFILIILTVLIVSVPGAVISIRDMSFTYPAAAVMIQTIKNGHLMRVIGASDPEAADPGSVAASAIKEAQEKQKSAGNESSGDASMKIEPVSGSHGDDAYADKDEEDTEERDESEEDETEAHDEEESDEDADDDDDEKDDEDESGAEKEEDGEEELKEFTTVDDDYFEDACFIGDSRVQGLGLYSGLPATNYGIVSMQLYRVFDKKVISTDAGKVTIPEALATGTQYGKIYLGFGLNEMGWGNDEMFAEYYYGLIDYIKAVQPDAIIYVMGIIHVTASEEQSSSVYTNEHINHRNELLKEIAENEHVYYLDLNEVFTDENGRLAAEESFDGIHIKAGAIDKWAEYLRTHAIID